MQVAGVIDQAEAELLVSCGVDFLGFPLRLAHHREDLGEAEAARIVATLPSQVESVLITYLERADEIASLSGELGVGWVQLHAEVDVGEIRRLRELAPRLRILRSLVVGADPRIEATALRLAPWVDGFLTDTYDPESRARGATGRTHDWAVSRALVECSPRPVILAGGLTPGNVRDAVAAVRPSGVDAHTGLEGPDGRKDAALVRRFVAEARAGFAALIRA